MGTISYIACKVCKVTRDLDKFYNQGYGVSNREEALEHAKEIEANSFRPALLVSFMAAHIGHECVFFNEHSGCEEQYDPYYKEDNGYSEDTDFFV